MDGFYSSRRSPQALEYGEYASQVRQQQASQFNVNPAQSLDEALVMTADGQHQQQQVLQENPENQGDPWNELASWYWDLWNDHENIFSPSHHDPNLNVSPNYNRQQSYDSTESVVDGHAIAEDRALHLPSKSFRDQLVLLYFNHVHPVWPIFDETEIYNAYCQSEDGLTVLRVITLLEFQALLFAGSLVSSTADPPCHSAYLASRF
jgi:hypothetical protein